MTHSENDKRIVAEILTQFMFVNSIYDFVNIWDEIFTKYELREDPFTGCICTEEQYYESKKEYERQKIEILKRGD